MTRPDNRCAGTLLERYLRTIDLCNDSQLIKDESGLWKITGGPTEGALKVLAAKVPAGGQHRAAQ
jgi:magnesium-transporting ATPase (P-type)